ncbi:MAG: hypothetical protein ABFD54_02590 [Armatimonadota bacterium]|nr:hypothetical protein [bacterium]
MKKIVALITVAAACLLAGSVQAQNLLSNPDFESLPANLHLSTGSSVVGDWRYFSVSGASSVLDTTSDTHSGSIAVKMTRSNTVADAGLDRDGSSLRVSVVAGHMYQCSAWAKTPSAGSMLLIVAYHDSDGNWLETQSSQTFPLTQNYKQCSITCAPPAGTASINFSLRVNGTGTIIVDDCAVTEVVPGQPSITYPDSDVVDSFKPVIAFTGVPHTAYQVVISSGSTVVWDSGIVNDTAFTCPVGISLQPSHAYTSKVRVQNVLGWGDYCAPVRFATPAAPIVKLTSPREADSVIDGPGVKASWKVESPGSVISQSITVDNNPAVQLATTALSYDMTGLGEGVHSVVLKVTTTEGTATDTSRFNVHVTPSSSGTMYYYDLSYALGYSRYDSRQLGLSYDIPMAVIALQGLVNRSGTKLFVKLNARDDVWLDRQRAPGNWLAGKNIVTLPSGAANLTELFNTFKSYFNGAVIWDPNVNATSNVATTVAGADNLIPIRYDLTPGSVYNTLVTSGPMIPVKVDLTNKFTGTGTIWNTSIPSTGSKKCDAYVWARTQYLETGKSNPNLLFYGIDAYWMTNYANGAIANYIPNKDYIIRDKGFAFDLNVWGDETPVDDPNQPLGTDLNTFTSILSAASVRAPGMVEIVGFFPWPVKYSYSGGAGGTHEPVSGEWKEMQLGSAYNAYSDSDALAYNMELANGSIYCQFPLPERYTQNRKYSQTDLRKLGYVNKNNVVSNLNYLNFYIGDYDSGSWVYFFGNTNWSDPGRGLVPMSWAFNPNLVKRIGPIFDYYYRTRSANDFFVAGDSGAGYTNPSGLIGTRPSGLPSARDTWIKHNLDYFRRMNVKLTGFVINGHNGPIMPEVDDMYSTFSVDGTFSQPLWYPQGDHMYGSMPAMTQQCDLQSDTAAAVKQVHNYGLLMAPRFLNFRSIIQTPTWLKSIYDGVVASDAGMPWAIVDAETYAALAKCNMGVIADGRATYTFDTIPSTLYKGATFTASIGVRNDGWVPWSATGTNAVTLTLKWMQGTQVISSATVALPRDVASGDGIVLDITSAAPSTPGNYTLHYEMARSGVGFTSLGDYAWEAPRTVLSVPRTVSMFDAKIRTLGTYVALNAVLVAEFGDQYYFETSNRTSGIRVDNASINLGDTDISKEYTIVGYTRLDTANQERYIDAQSLIPTGSTAVIAPLGLTNKSMGGGDLGNVAGGLGQTGVTEGTGLNNIGLLIKTSGRASNGNADGFDISDGSAVAMNVAYAGAGSTYDGKYVAVTGISGISNDGTRLIKVQRSTDIQIISL